MTDYEKDNLRLTNMVNHLKGTLELKKKYVSEILESHNKEIACITEKFIEAESSQNEIIESKNRIIHNLNKILTNKDELIDLLIEEMYSKINKTKFIKLSELNSAIINNLISKKQKDETNP